VFVLIKTDDGTGGGGVCRGGVTTNACASGGTVRSGEKNSSLQHGHRSEEGRALQNLISSLIKQPVVESVSSDKFVREKRRVRRAGPAGKGT